MDESNRLPAWLRRALIGAALFLAGGLIAFGYSYRPLHGSMTWKIEELEQRIDERNRTNMMLGDELARLRSQDASRIDPITFAQVERELDKTNNALVQAEKDLKRAERKRIDANASASRWRKRYEGLRDQPSAPAAQASPRNTPTAEPIGSASIKKADSPDAASPAPAESGILPPEATSKTSAPGP